MKENKNSKHLQSRHYHKQDESIADTSCHKKKHNALILLSIIIMSLILMLLCLSCQPRNEARYTASRFLNIVCGKDTGDYTRLYPHADNLRYLLHLEQYRIKNAICIDSNKVKVRVLGEYQEGRMKMTKSYKRMLKDGKSTQKDITLFLKPRDRQDLSKGYLIYDSKGLIDIDKNDSVFTYAYWNGYIHEESTDQEVARAMKICKFYVVTHNMTKGLDLKEKEEQE